ncbi:MAG: shikimate dehydrogenase [Gemmatimonadetes bacterium]|nr:shikimate dehydrogenase [Gemmatimonadota bacterium]
MITSRTGLLGVIGYPVEHSSSPAMHNAALARTELDFAYLPFAVPPDRVAGVPMAMRTLGIRGLNVTVPHKVAVMEGLDEISEEARAIGAVNTIANRDGHLTGYNTDAEGVIASLRADGGLDVLPEAVALLGAGGAARAILYALLQAAEVKEVTLHNRTLEKAEALAADLDPGSRRVRVGTPGMGPAFREAGLLINATSVGMHPGPEASPLPDPSVLHDRLTVLDIVYKPRRTRLLAQAEEAGAATVDGLGMLVHQGARAFEIWTGVPAPVEEMKQALLRRVEP